MPNACSQACKIQYDQCLGTYAQGCKDNQQGGSSWGDVWSWLGDLFNFKRDATATSYFTYAKASESVKRTTKWGDSYSTATNKCQQQYQDCLNANRGTSGSGKCGSWGGGW